MNEINLQNFFCNKYLSHSDKANSKVYDNDYYLHNDSEILRTINEMEWNENL